MVFIFFVSDIQTCWRRYIYIWSDLDDWLYFIWELDEEIAFDRENWKYDALYFLFHCCSFMESLRAFISRHYTILSNLCNFLDGLLIYKCYPLDYHWDYTAYSWDIGYIWNYNLG